MNEILRIASSVSTPLALAGLIAAILFLVFRQLLKMNVFPTLNQALGGEIIISIVNKLFILALVAMLLGFVGYIASRQRAPTIPPDSNNVNLPSGYRLKEAIAFIAQSDQAVATFSANCTEAVLNAEITGGEFGASDTAGLIEHLRYRAKTPGAIPGLHAKLKERGVYEISCN